MAVRFLSRTLVMTGIILVMAAYVAHAQQLRAVPDVEGQFNVAVLQKLDASTVAKIRDFTP